MIIKLKCLKDNWLNSNSQKQDYNYGYDNVVSLIKDSSSTGRIISKFDFQSFYDFASTHRLSLSEIESVKMKYYDISNFNILNPKYINLNDFSSYNIQVEFLDRNFDEGVGSDSSSVSGYSNWNQASTVSSWDTYYKTIVFDGNDRYLLPTITASNTGYIQMDILIPSSTSTSQVTILDILTNTFPEITVDYNYSTDKFEVFVWDDNNNFYDLFSSTITAFTEYFTIKIEINTDTVKFYLNGDLQDTAILTDTLTLTGHSSFSLGSLISGSSTLLNGTKIKNLKGLWNFVNFYTDVAKTTLATTGSSVAVITSSFVNGGDIVQSTTGNRGTLEYSLTEQYGGSVSSITASTLTSTLIGSYQDLNLDISTYLTYLYQSYTALTADLNNGFLIRIDDTGESSTADIGRKDFISKDTNLKSYAPEIVIDINRIYKDESNSYEKGRNNIFGMQTLNTSFQNVSITSINSVTLSAYTNSALTALTGVSSSTAVSVSTIIDGYSTFTYNIPNSISAYYSPFLTIVYTDDEGTSVTATKNLTQTYLLSSQEHFALINSQANIYFNPNNIFGKIDITKEFNQFNIVCVYTTLANQLQHHVFHNNYQKILKTLEYKLYDENDKLIIDWEYCNYNDTSNFILVHNSLLNENMKYYFDVRFSGKLFEKLITFNT